MIAGFVVHFRGRVLNRKSMLVDSVLLVKFNIMAQFQLNSKCVALAPMGNCSSFEVT